MLFVSALVRGQTPIRTCRNIGTKTDKLIGHRPADILADVYKDTETNRNAESLGD